MRKPSSCLPSEAPITYTGSYGLRRTLSRERFCNVASVLQLLFATRKRGAASEWVEGPRRSCVLPEVPAPALWAQVPDDGGYRTHRESLAGVARRVGKLVDSRGSARSPLDYEIRRKPTDGSCTHRRQVAGDTPEEGCLVPRTKSRLREDRNWHGSGRAVFLFAIRGENHVQDGGMAAPRGNEGRATGLTAGWGDSARSRHVRPEQDKYQGPARRYPR